MIGLSHCSRGWWPAGARVQKKKVCLDASRACLQCGGPTLMGTIGGAPHWLVA
jgi:hypothetical protein